MSVAEALIIILVPPPFIGVATYLLVRLYLQSSGGGR